MQIVTSAPVNITQYRQIETNEEMTSSEEQNHTDFKDLLEELGIEEDDLIKRVLDEKKESDSATSNRKDLFRERIRLYNNQDKDHDVVSINSIYNVMQTLLALYYTDKLTVTFAPRTIWYDEIADNLENLAQFDQDEMGMDVINYQVQWDRMFFGVGIRVLVGFNEITKSPIFEVKDPLSWYPDPNGRLDIKNFRYCGFESIESKELLTADKGFFNIGKIQTGKSEELINNEDYYQNPRSIQQDNQAVESRSITTYNHYTIINGVKILVTMGGDKFIIRAQKVMAMGIEEEKDPGLVNFPIVLNYYSPVRGDPRGISLPDLLEDKQRAYSVLFNLNKIKATREALGGHKFYDPRGIRNLADIERPSIYPRRIAVNIEKMQGRGLQDIVYEPGNASRVNSDSYNFQGALLNEMQLSTGIDATTLGIRGDKNITATESQTIQQNANIRFILGNRINAWGEKQFWTLWYRSYAAFFGSAEEKFIRVNSGFGMKGTTLRKKDFITSKDPEIMIISSYELGQQREQDKANFMSMYPTYMQRPDVPKVSKTFASRKMWKLLGLTREEILIFEPESYEEKQAKKRLELINNNENPPKIRNLYEDHLTYIIVYQSADANTAQRRAIAEREQAYIMSGQQQALNQAMSMNNPAMNSAGNAGTNMMISNAISKQSEKGKSANLGDVTQ